MLNAEQLGEALRRAFNFGQTYWRQADSDSYKQNALSDKTLNQFNDLVRDTVAAHGVPASDPDRFIGGAAGEATYGVETVDGGQQ
jgi:hypothetical protein